MTLVVSRKGRRWRVVRTAPQLDLVGAVLLGRLGLVASLKVAVMALVEAPMPASRDPEAVDDLEGEVRRPDRPLLERGVHDVRREAGVEQEPPCRTRFLLALGREVDVVPPCEQVELVPLALPVADE